MSKEKLLETLGQVKEEFIEEAAPKGLLDNAEKTADIVKKSGRITKLYPYLKWGSLAACLCIIVGLGMKVMPFSAAKNDAAYESADQMKPATQGESFNAKTDSLKQDKDYSSGKSYSNITNGNTADNTGESNYEMNTDCSKASEEAEKAPGQADKGFPDWGLTLSVKNVTSTGLTLVVTQSGGNPTGDILTGEPYRLIALVDDTWKAVEELPLPEGVDGRGFNSIGYWIQKGETREFDINWEWMFGELPSGTYRLIKEFSDFRETANYDPFEYWVEFYIE